MRLLEETTIFHITHYKAGSRWVFRILRRCARDRLVQVKAGREEVLEEPIVPGGVYSACYLSRDEFDRIDAPADSRRFFIMRDLRDTLVSGYFSLRGSHPQYKNRAVADMRERVQAMELEQGLLHTLEDWLPVNAEIQRSWVESGEQLIRYEDLLVDDKAILEEILLDKCELGVSRRKLGRAIDKESFEQLSGGRARGEEDTSAHYRKGIAGDWRNYFTERIKDEFKRRYGDLLISTGYERDDAW